MVVHLIDFCQVDARFLAYHRGGRFNAVGGYDSNGGTMAEERRKAAWIGGSILVKGDVVSTEDLVIDGQVQGTIELGDHSLVIGQRASVVADLVAKMVTISGEVKGNVIGSGRVELKAGARVEGDITAPKFVMEDGAALSGKVDTGPRNK
jgi:cytoskeletal protein CcmA (bactofilin family)